jgi:hypothetical protein
MVRAPVTASAAMEAIALTVVAVAAAILRRLRLSAGDERGQSADIVAALLRLMLLRLRLVLLRLVLLRLVLLRLILRLLLRPVEVLLSAAVRLLPAIGLLLRLLLRLEVGLLAAEILLRLLPALAGVAAAVFHNTLGARFGRRGLRLVVRILLAELLLRRRDQAQIVLGVLVMGFGGDVIAARGRVAREL